MLRRIAIAGLLVSVASCSYNASVRSTSAPSSEIRLDRHRDTQVTVVIDNSIENLTREVDASTYVCSAHNYPLEVGPALRQSIQDVMRNAYSSVDISGHVRDNATSPRTYVFDLESFDPQLHFNMGFWSGKASADVSIVLRVTVLNEFREELVRTTVAGDGRAGPMSGGCGDGAQVLADASREAIEDMLERFVLKVINSDRV